MIDIDRSDRTILAVLGFSVSAGLAVYSLLLTAGALLAIAACSAEAERFGCDLSLKHLTVGIPALANLVGLVVAGVLTWMLPPSPRLRWLGAGLVLQSAGIILGYSVLPAAGFRLG